ncbi:MAG: DUF4255 domain-containing protein [Tildeniella torsiva UHER 1998/13D]|jgi:hypothetical protein|nr:DUF4255 domain-containing protein [Tildeniella torsiva UHER 1998/13D]
MANVRAIHSVGESLVTYLQTAYLTFQRQQEQLALAAGPEGAVALTFPDCQFRLLSSNAMDDVDGESDTLLSLYLHRVAINEHLRNSRPANGLPRQEVPLSVDLHYLLTVWADSALAEHILLAWTMRQFHRLPILDESYLSTDAGWGPGEVVQIIPAELSNEDMMRIWDTLKPSYHLSVAYIARVVQIEVDEVEDSQPVVAMRLGWGDRTEVAQR